QDALSGLLYLRARYYQPSVGRFLSRDPVQAEPMEPAELHLYTYTVNNPIAFYDPSGQSLAEYTAWLQRWGGEAKLLATLAYSGAAIRVAFLGAQLALFAKYLHTTLPSWLKGNTTIAVANVSKDGGPLRGVVAIYNGPTYADTAKWIAEQHPEVEIIPYQ